MGRFDATNVGNNSDLADSFAACGASEQFVERIRKFGTDVPDHLVPVVKETAGTGR